MRPLFVLLLMAGAAVAQPIEDSPGGDLDFSSILDQSLIRVPVSDIQAGTPGIGKDIGIDKLAQEINSHIVTATSHGFTSADEGKPLYGFAIYDDTDLDQSVSWLLLKVVDTNTLKVIPAGEAMDVPVALLEGGNAYDVATSGRPVYYDTSASLYKPVSSSTADPALVILSVGTTTFKAFLCPQPRNTLGIVNVHHADGTSQRFVPVADTDSARGDALELALSALTKSTVAGKPGSTLVCSPGLRYEIDDITLDDRDGCRIVGNGAILIDDGTYDHILLFTNSDDLFITGLWLIGSTTVQETPTNAERGTGLYLSECDRCVIRDVTSNWHCGLQGFTGEFPSNISSYGMHIQDCEDILIENSTVNHNGRYGLEIRESVRITVRNLKAVNNGRAAINVANGSVSPEWLTIDGVQGYGDQNFSNPLMSGCPGISVGSGTTWAQSRVTITNCDLEWTNVDHDSSSLGGAYPMIKITDYEFAAISDTTLQQDANAGDMDEFAISFWDTDNVSLINLKTDSDIRNNSTARMEQLTMIGCTLNRAERSVSATFGFEVDRAVVRGCEMWFTNSALDFSTASGNYREVTGNTFHGAGSSDYVFSSSDTIENAAGKLVVSNNELDNCSYADDAAVIATIRTGGRITFADGDTSPAVTDGVSLYETANTSSTTITDFDGESDGDTMTLYVNDGNTTIQHSVDIQLQGATDFVSGSGGGMLTFVNNGGTWFETGRATF